MRCNRGIATLGEPAGKPNADPGAKPWKPEESAEHGAAIHYALLPEEVHLKAGGVQEGDGLPVLLDPLDALLQVQQLATPLRAQLRLRGAGAR